MLAWIAASWIAGLFLGAQWASSWAPLLLAPAIVGSVAVARRGAELRARLWVAPLSVAAFLCGLGASPPAPTPCLSRDEVEGTAEVESVRHGHDHTRLRLRVLEAKRSSGAGRIPSDQRVEGHIETPVTPPVGARVSFRARLRPRTELRNPSPHPQLSPPRMSCWASWAEGGAPALITASRFQRWLSAIRSEIRQHLLAGLPSESAAVARALVLGDGGALGYERRKNIAAVGLAHLFAVSGLHIALVSGTLVAGLRWLLRGLAVGFHAGRIAAALGVPLTLLHAALAGGSPSAWRAATTAAITWGFVASGKRVSAAAVTGAAALALSVPDPSIALRPAFLLSIVATSAILSRPPIGGRWRKLRSAAVVSARTLVATAPLVWWWFGSVPLIGWLTNIVVLPLGSWVVIPLAHLFALTTWAPAVAPHLAPAVSASVRMLLWICDTLRPLAITERLPPLDPAQGVIVLVTCTAWLALERWRPRARIGAVAIVLWLIAELGLVAREQPEGLLRVTFVDVGQGDAAVVDFPDGRVALVDTGRGAPHPASRALVELLAARRRSRIDWLVITHGHPDHAGGLRALLEHTSIGEVWVSGQQLVEERDGAMERVLNRALQLGTSVRFAPDLCDHTKEIGGARLEVLWPCPRYDPGLGLNDNSLVLRLSYGQHDVLLTGDIEAEAEARLVANGLILPVDVLKVPHHGSRTSSTAPFVDAARPSVAVISSGAGNRYGHPSPLVLERLRASGARILRTDRGGGVIVSTDGARLRVHR